MSLESIADDRKLSPSNYPELPVKDLYTQSYEKYISQGLKQSHAVERVADQFNVHSSTVYFELFPHKKELHKKRPSWDWQYESTQPNFSREKYNQVKAHRIKVRRSIDKYVNLAFAMSGYQSMELPKLADLINEMAGVRFNPSSFHTLNNQYEKKTGQPLIERYQCHVLPQYALYRQ